MSDKTDLRDREYKSILDYQKMTDFQHDSSFSSGDTFGINQNPQTDQESEQLKADKERIYK